MVGGVSHGGIDSQLQQRRAALAGKAGAAGLVSNGRTTAIALFASMGGLIYGYNQGEFRRPSGSTLQAEVLWDRTRRYTCSGPSQGVACRRTTLLPMPTFM